MAWRIVSTTEEHVSGPAALLSMIACHEAWSRLSPIQRVHLERAGEDGQLPPMHPRTFRALVAHGICDERGVLTPAGRDVARFRPDTRRRS